MRKVLDNIIWGFLLLLASPTVMIVASWNSVPGDPMFGMKRALEQTLLVLASPSYATKGTLQVKYTERRFSEASRLLADKASVEGLVYLNDQVATTKSVIREAPNPKVQRELAVSYVESLTKLSGQLEEQKQTVAGAPPVAGDTVIRNEVLPQQPEVSPVDTASQRTRPAVSIAPTTAVAVRAPQQPAPQPRADESVKSTAAQSVKTAAVVAEISQTQVQIQQTIKEMQSVAKEAEKKEAKEEKKSEDKKEETKKDQGGDSKKDEKKD